MDMTTSPTVQDVSGIIGRGIDTYRQTWVPATGLAIAVFAVFGVARIIAQQYVDSGDIVIALLIDYAGLTAATIVALPWFRLMLSAERGQGSDFPALGDLDWGTMVVAALFFWAGILLGIRYMVGIPSIFMLIWYGLFGFAVATGVRPGLKALGTSVRLGQGRRWTVALLAAILAFVNFVGILPIGAGVNPATVALAVALLSVTTNVSMGAGAHLFDWLARSESR